MWEDNTWSIVSTKDITNKKMLYNKTLIDDVIYKGKDSDKPEEGWKKYPARVLKLGSK